MEGSNKGYGNLEAITNRGTITAIGMSSALIEF